MKNAQKKPLVSKTKTPSAKKPQKKSVIAKKDVSRVVPKSKTIARAMHGSEKIARLLIGMLPDAALLTDTKGVILDVNVAFARRMGKSVKTLIGSNAYDLLPPPLQQARKKKVRELVRTGEPVLFEDNRGGKILKNALYPIKDGKGKVVYVAGYSYDITRQKQGEMEVLLNRERLSLIFNAVSDMMMLLSVEADQRLVIEAVNDRFLQNGYVKALKLGGGILIGRDRSEVWMDVGFSREQVIEWEKPMRQAIKTRKTVKYEERVPIPGGTLIQEVSCVPTLNDKGKVTHLVWSAHDITDRKLAEEKSRQQAEAMTALYDTTHDLIIEHNLDKLLHTIVERAARLVNAASGGLYLCEPQNDLVRCAISYKTPCDYTGITLKYGEGVAGRVAKTGESFIIKNYKKWKGHAKAYKDEPFRAILGVPMKWQGEMIGVLEVLEHSWEREFTEDEKKLIASFANQAAVAVRNARLYEQLQQELAERKQAEEKLRESEANLIEAQRISHLGSWNWDLSTNRIKCSDEMFRIVGLSPDEIEVTPDTFTRFLHPDEVDSVLQKIQQQLTGSSSKPGIEHRIVQPDGSVRFVFSQANVYFDKYGKPVRLVGSTQDITKRKHIDDVLRASEEKYRTLIDAMAEGVWVIDAENHTTFANPQMAKLLGYTTDEMLGKSLFDFMDDEGKVLADENVKRRKQGVTEQLDFQFKRKDGSDLWAFLSTNPVMDSAGKYAGAMAVVTDITERKHNEALLREAEARYRTLFEQSPYGIVLIDLESGKTLDANTIAYQQLGYTREEFAELKISDYEVVESPDEVAQHMKKVLTDGSDEFDTLQRTKGGEIRNVHVWTKLLEIGERPVAFTIFQDVSERIYSEQRYQHILNTAIDGFWLTDNRGNLLEVNEAYCRMSGYTRKELLQMSINDIDVAENEAETKAHIEAVVTKGSERFITRHRRKDGGIIDVEISAQFVNSQGGFFVAFLQNITERKRADDTLRQQEALLETFFSQSLDGFFFMMLDEPIEWNDSVDKDQLLDYAFTHQHMIKANNAMLTQYGVSREQFLGLTPSDLMSYDISYGKKLWRSLFDDGRLAIKTGEKKLDGTPMWIEGEYVCLHDAQGRITGHFGIQREVTAQKKMEDELRIKNDAVASSVVGTSFTDMNGKIFYSNDAWLKMFGYESMDQIVGTSPTEHTMDPADASIVMQAMAVDGQWLGELTGKRRDGSAFEFQLAANLVENEIGQPIAMLGSFLDVTDRKRTMEALRRSEALLSDAQRISHIGSWELDLQTNRLTWSDEIYRIFEIDPQRFDASYDAFLNAIHPDDREVVNKEYSASVENHSHYSIEHRLQMADGRIKYVHEEGETFYDDGGKPIRSIGTVHDITERKRADERLRASEQRLSNAQRIAHLGYWSWNVSTNEVEWSDETKLIFGYRPEMGNPSAELFASFIHSEDRAMMQGYTERIMAGKAEPDLEYRITRPDGETRILSTRIESTVVSETNATFITGILQDITERKRVEAKLQEYQETLVSLIDALPDSGILVDKNGVILAINQPSLTRIKKKHHEVVGKSAYDILPPAVRDERVQAMNEAIHTGRLIHYEDEMFGRILDNYLNPVLDANGNVYRVAIFSRDITESRRAEDELRVKDNAIESSFNAIAISGADGNLTYVNDAFVKLWGLNNKEDALGHSALEFWVEPENAIQVISTIQEHGSWSGEMSGKRRDGSPFDALISASVIKNKSGQVTHMMASFIDITARKEAEEYIKASLLEKEVLLKEIHHRVKNNLQVISSLLYLQARKLETGELKNMFLESQNRISTMSLIHEKLYQSADLARISFGEYARDLVYSLFHTYGVERSQVGLSVDSNGYVLDINNAVPCGLIINEIISNSLKYAFPDGRHGVIRIVLDRGPDNRFNLIVSDDGVGLPDDFETRSMSSLGTRLIERLAEQIQGTIERRASSVGTEYCISFPSAE